MTIAARLGLGGAQFGLDYGITNSEGRLTPGAIEAILAHADTAGIAFIDTAPAYGNSEQIIGASGHAQAFGLVTKTAKLDGITSSEAAKAQVRASLVRSMACLATDQFDSVLVHEADDLLGPGGPGVWAALEQAKAEGRTRRIGVSVYRGDQIDRLIDRYPLDIVQLPLNVLDRRLEEGGQLARLARAGVAIHARSLFLQGLILQSPDRIPARFGPLIQAVRDLAAWAETADMTVLQAALAYPLRHAHVECAIVGVSSLGELDAILSAAAAVAERQMPPAIVTSRELTENYLDPSQWADLR